MLRNLNQMKGFSILAEDGEIGKVEDFYIDDQELVVRYAIVDTGNWLQEHKVLISPESFKEPDFENEKFPVSLTKEEIENSPPVDKKEPVSRQMEEELAKHYKWTPYWVSGVGATPSPAVGPYANRPVPLNIAQAINDEETDDYPEVDTHLRSINEINGYSIDAKDGKLGHIEDYIVCDQSWTIRYLVIDTRNWLPGKKVLIAPEWIVRISWNKKHITVDLTQDKIKNAPEYDSTQSINRKYEIKLYQYYGKEKYWD